MDCDRARLIFQTAHPIASQLEAREADELAAHFADCADCGPWAAHEQRIDAHLGAAMRAVAVPANLKQKITRRLDVQRDAWRIRWVRRIALAASLLVAVGFGGYLLWWGHKPQPDLAAFLDSHPQNFTTGEDVEHRFAELGVPMIAPAIFNYHLLESYALADIQGKRVPCLTFLYHSGKANDPPALAFVYVLSERQFDLRAPIEQLPRNSHWRMDVEEFASAPGNRYVIVYSDRSSPGWFFVRAAQ